MSNHPDPSVCLPARSPSISTLSKGRGRTCPELAEGFGRLRPKSVRGLPSNQLEVTQSSLKGPTSVESAMAAARPHAVNARLDLQPVHCDREGVGVAQCGRSRFDLRCQPAIRREGHGYFVQAAVGAQAGGAQDR